MVDGEELLIDFYNIIRKEKQTLSEYISDLYIELGDVVKHGGLHLDHVNKTLLKQFIRGCCDDDLLVKLRLEDEVSNPPQFPDLIARIRREEARRTGRRLLSKKQARSQAVVVEEPAADEAEVELLRRRVAQLEAAASKAEPQPAPTPVAMVTTSPEVAQLQHRLAEVEDKLKVRQNSNIFCYRCGQDAHMATECQNPPNKALVQEKREARKKHFDQHRQNHLNLK